MLPLCCPQTAWRSLILLTAPRLQPPTTAAFPADLSFSTVEALLAGIVDASESLACCIHATLPRENMAPRESMAILFTNLVLLGVQRACLVVYVQQANCNCFCR